MSKYHVLRIRNRGVGTYVYYKPLEPQCHVCQSKDEPLKRCQRCYKRACDDHYNYHHRMCTDCLHLYQQAPEQS